MRRFVFSAIGIASVVALGVTAATASPQALYQALLITAYPDSQLPGGFSSAKVSVAKPSATSLKLHAVGGAYVTVDGPDPNDEITYTVFARPADALARFTAAEAEKRSGVKRVGKVPGYSIPSLWEQGSYSGQDISGKTRTWGYTEMTVWDGSVMVDVTTNSLDNTESGNVPAAVALLKSALRHLHVVEAVVSGNPGAATKGGTPAGTRGKPYPLRTLVSIPDSKGWKLQVNKSVPNGTSLVMAKNQFNDRPKPGRQFFLINTTAIYTGKGSSNLELGTTLSAVGRSNVAYDSGDNCGVIPRELDTLKTVFTGGRLTGNICFSVKSTDAASLLLLVEPTLSFNGAQLFFKVR